MSGPTGRITCAKFWQMIFLINACLLEPALFSFICCGVEFQTLCALVRAVYRKRLGDHGFDVINILIGFDAAEAQMQVMFFNKFVNYRMFILL